MNTRRFLTNWLEQIWYGSRPLERTLLLPLSKLFSFVSERRRKKLTEWQRPNRVPVIIVGNIAVGGTGKTPLTIRLAQLLREQGYYPGIVSRGYGAKAVSKAAKTTDDAATLIKPVSYQSLPEEVGDEALLLAARTGLPVVVGVDRPKVVDYLLDNHEVDIVLSDDGLQHYKLAREMEIVVVDGLRRFGNGYCLPAGPLREKRERIEECDFVVCNTHSTSIEASSFNSNGRAQFGEYAMRLSGNWLVSLSNKRVTRPLSELDNKTVHVVTAIGNPQRFLKQLTKAGLHCREHLYPDHYLFSGDEFSFSDELPILMTEKDAVKCQQFSAEQLENCWYLPVDARLDTEFEQAFLQRVTEITAELKRSE